jgi:23S rRNA (guanine2445-N2)-methyltransferase / 23S rRNA (guanine2069-N7)-methyltransferase
MNGPIECELLKIPVETSGFVTSRRSSDPDNYQQGLSEQAKMLANRLQKNIASLKSFLKQQNIESYRIYDADLPDYSAAIDVYDDCLHIQEYAPPKTIDSHKAQRRLRDIERVAAGVLSISADKVFVKTRARQKGDTQYEKQALQHKLKIVSEANAKFELNLSDYLDTGLFLDHRKVRAQLAKWSDHNTRLLNLFCYTGSASVQAALKGAKTVNVDLSNTYLDWAKRNYALNGLNTQQHQFIRANCIEWLEQVKETHAGSFDLIFIDPPTFSNSKKMEKHFDIQQEHEAMLKSALVLLKSGGKMIFSNNFKRFKMAFDGNEQGVKVKEMTRETTSRDFSKKPLHRSWLIEKS